MPGANGAPGGNGGTAESGKDVSDWSWVGETAREWTGRFLDDGKIPVEYTMNQQDKMMLLMGAVILWAVLK
jgi:hypothetical protein